MKASLFWLIIISIVWVTYIQKLEGKKEITRKIVKDIIKEETTIQPKVKVFSKTVIGFAKGNIGKPYVFGKKGPNSFDCSGFVYAMYKQLGIVIPRSSLNQSIIKGSKISRDFLKKGDLVFFDTAKKGKVNHVGIYLGKGKFIHASSGKANSVTISSLDTWYKDKFKWGKRIYANK